MTDHRTYAFRPIPPEIRIAVAITLAVIILAAVARHPRRLGARGVTGAGAVTVAIGFALGMHQPAWLSIVVARWVIYGGGVAIAIGGVAWLLRLGSDIAADYRGAARDHDF